MGKNIEVVPSNTSSGFIYVNDPSKSHYANKVLLCHVPAWHLPWPYPSASFPTKRCVKLGSFLKRAVNQKRKMFQINPLAVQSLDNKCHRYKNNLQVDVPFKLKKIETVISGTDFICGDHCGFHPSFSRKKENRLLSLIIAFFERWWLLQNLTSRCPGLRMWPRITVRSRCWLSYISANYSEEVTASNQPSHIL